MNQESLESLSKFANALALGQMAQSIPAITAVIDRLWQSERVYAELMALGATGEEIDAAVALPRPRIKSASEAAGLVATGEIRRLEEDATEYLRRLEYTRRRYTIDGRMPLEQGES
jgi:hypothetical protein